LRRSLRSFLLRDGWRREGMLQCTNDIKTRRAAQGHYIFQPSPARPGNFSSVMFHDNVMRGRVPV
jgi:hypothetical protein